MPPAPALLDQRVIDVGTIGQDHVSDGVLVLVVAVGLDRDFLAKGEVRGSLLRSPAERLAFLGAVDPTQADAFRVLVVQNFEGVAVEDGDDGSGKVSECS